MPRLGRGFGFSRRHGAISALGQLTLTVDTTTLTVDAVAPTLSFTYADPAATSTVAMPDVGITIQGTELNLTWDTATATVAMVLPALQISYTTPVASTSALIAVPPVLSLSYTTPAAASSALILVLPALRLSYTTPAASSSALIAVPPGLLHRYVVPAATASVTGGSMDITRPVPTATASVELVAPTLRVSYTTPAASTSALIGVPPTLSHTYTWASATAGVAMPDVGITDVETLTFTWDLTSTSVVFVPPALHITSTVPAAAATAELLLPTLRIKLNLYDYVLDENGLPILDEIGEPIASEGTPSPYLLTEDGQIVYTEDGEPILLDGVSGNAVWMPDVALDVSDNVNVTWESAEADVEAVAPALSHTYSVPAATASAELVLPTLRVTYTWAPATADVSMADVGFTEVETLTLVWDEAEATVIAVAPALSYVYDITETTATAAMPDVTLQLLSIVTLVVDTATATVAANVPGLAATFGVPAGSVSGAGVTPTTSFTFAVATATAGVAMPDVGITEVETLTFTWDVGNTPVTLNAPALSDTYSVPAATSAVAAVAPALSVTLPVATAVVTISASVPGVTYTYSVSSATATVAGGNVAVTSEGEFVVFAAEITAVLVPPTLSITLDAVDTATASVEMPDVTLTEYAELDLTWEAAEASVAMADVGISITPVITPTPTPGAGGGQLLEFVFNDLDLRVEPATASVVMIPPAFTTYQPAKRRRKFPFLRRPVEPVFEVVHSVPAPMPVVAFTVEPENRYFFKVKPAQGLALAVAHAHYLDENYSSYMWGRYRRRTPEEEAYELALIGFTL